MKKLTPTDIEKVLSNLEGWTYEGDFISKTFLFKDFIQAFAFMTKVAIISEKLNHHPDWSNVYNKVHIQLITHDVGGITEKDIAFVKRVASIVEV